MNRPLPRAILLCLCVGLGLGCSNLSRVDFSRLLISGRDGWQHPEEVIAALELSPGDRVADIGAGGGYWLPWLSAAVGPEGIVYAVEVEDELVAALKERVARESLENVVVLLGAYGNPRLPADGVDIAFTCLTYHHIEDRVPYFTRLHGSLSERGRVAHLDDRHDVGAPISWFQSEGHWSDPAAIAAEMREAGYERVASFDFLPAQSFQVFVPARGDGGS